MAGGNDKQFLCPRCALLDIGEHLSRQNAGAFNEVVAIWSWNDYENQDWLDPDCSFCSLVAIIKKPHDTSQAELWFFSPPEYLYLLPNPISSRPISLGLRKEVRRKLTRDGSSTTWRDKDGRTWRTWTLFLASRGNVHGQRDLFIRKINHRHIDFNVPRAWLSQEGPSTLSQRPSAVPNIPSRLIDCQTRTVIDAGIQPYLALSYVWGTVTFDCDTEYSILEGGLPEKLPSTIADAMAATRELGYRYLWVDKYTIDQHDERSKLHDIQSESMLPALYPGDDCLSRMTS